jgi:hypothetical protein
LSYVAVSWYTRVEAPAGRIEEARRSLPVDEFDRAFARGAAMSYEEVVQCLLDELRNLTGDE